MFFKKLFNFSKDCNHYLEKGDRYMADEQYAHARNAYGEALEKIEAGSEVDLSRIETVRQKIALTGNLLGKLNLVEAEHAIFNGDRKKAGEHLNLILELADDNNLRKKSEQLLSELDHEPFELTDARPVKNCSSCHGGGDETESSNQYEPDDNISAEDRLALFFHALPEDLPARYAGMGEKFNRGCLLKLEGNAEQAIKVFEELSADEENDILSYEKAILYYENGNPDRSEQLLIKAISLNAANPLCNIGLVHLYSETGRVADALQILEEMIANNVTPEQATLMQGDLYEMQQDESNAIKSYSILLNSPKFAKEAAERIVPILERQGRTEEAVFLLKKYAKGCC